MQLLVLSGLKHNSKNNESIKILREEKFQTLCQTTKLCINDSILNAPSLRQQANVVYNIQTALFMKTLMMERLQFLGTSLIHLKASL